MNQQVLDKIHRHFETARLRVLPQGAIITLVDQEPEGVSLLLEGAVEQYDITPEGNKVTVNVFRPPAFFPMSWAINKTPNTYIYAALTEVRLKLADADSTVAFLQANPDVMFDLLSRVYRGTDALLRRRVITVRGVATNRLIFELLLEAYRFGTVTPTGKRLVTVQQRTLASRSGLARETVSRELHKLEGEQLIRRTKEGIELDSERLEQALGVAV